MSMQIWVSHQFEGFHHWPEAPEEVKYLRNRHRHMFHVALFVKVCNHDRDEEFHLVKRKLINAIESCLKHSKTDTWSCEKWCTEIRDRMPAKLDVVQVEVSEDGENGAIWQKD